MSSGVHREGVAVVLAESTRAVESEMRERLLERRNAGYLDVPDVEIEMLAKVCGMVARKAFANAIGSAFQAGINSTAQAAEHTEVTRKLPAA